MEKKFGDFSLQEALEKANTPSGQQLLAKLRQADPAQLEKIAKIATAGDSAKALRQLHTLLQQTDL